ncbi:hypothetical protein F4805DRAFT_12145 [Annulohypoxylon moriforme]|nr:hypothetical protein F4805DRAFT_12145 [Annulohypoxylon moriforme]
MREDPVGQQLQICRVPPVSHHSNRMYSKTLRCYWEFPVGISEWAFKRYPLDEGRTGSGVPLGFVNVTEPGTIGTITFAPASGSWLRYWIYGTIVLLRELDLPARKAWVERLPGVFNDFPEEWFGDSIRRRKGIVRGVQDLLCDQNLSTFHPVHFYEYDSEDEVAEQNVAGFVEKLSHIVVELEGLPSHVRGVFVKKYEYLAWRLKYLADSLKQHSDSPNYFHLGIGESNLVKGLERFRIRKNGIEKKIQYLCLDIGDSDLLEKLELLVVKLESIVRSLAERLQRVDIYLDMRDGIVAECGAKDALDYLHQVIGSS